VIPCEKSYVTSNVPAIAGKYREGSNFRDKKNDGISVYELNFDLDPQLVCDFIEIIYSGDLYFDSKNAIGFCILADCLNCAEFFEHGKKWVCANMKSEMMVDAWNYGDWFHESCLEYVQNSPELEIDQLYDQIGKLNLNKLNKFMEFINVSKKIGNGMLVYLKLEWISEQLNVDRYIDVLLKTDLSLIAEQHKLRYFLKICNNLESENLKNECREHMFKKLDRAIKRPQVDNTDLSRYNYFRFSDEVPENKFDASTTFSYQGENWLFLYSDEIQKDIPVISWRIKVLVFGTKENIFNEPNLCSFGIHEISKDRNFGWNTTESKLQFDIENEHYETVVVNKKPYGSAKLKPNDNRNKIPSTKTSD